MARTKWKNLKDYYSNVKRKVKECQRSGSEATYLNKGPFWERLQFLSLCSAEGSTVSNFNVQVTPEDTSPPDEESDDLFVLTGPRDETQEGTQKSPVASTSASSSDKKGKQQKRKRTTMQQLIERIEEDYEEDTQRIKRLEGQISASKKAGSFYLMIGEKMASFPRSQQLWMEDHIWNTYMQLEQSRSVGDETHQHPSSQQPPFQVTQAGVHHYDHVEQNRSRSSFAVLNSCMQEAFHTLDKTD